MCQGISETGQGRIISAKAKLSPRIIGIKPILAWIGMGLSIRDVKTCPADVGCAIFFAPEKNQDIAVGQNG